MVPFPVDDASSTTTPVRLSTVVMSAGTIRPEASWRWLRFLSRQPPAEERLPARRSVAESSGYWEGLDAEQTAAYRYALDHALSPTESSLSLGFDLYDLQAALQSILYEEREAEEVLAEMLGQAEAGRRAVEKEPEPIVVATARPEEPAEKEGERIVFVPRA